MKLKMFLLGASLITVSAVTMAAQPVAKPATLSHFSKAQQQELNAYLKQYLMDNPQIITASVRKMQMEARIKQYTAGRNRAIKLAAQLDKDKYSPAINTGPVTLVEFFDYQCSVCHMVFPQVEKVIKQHPHVRIVFKEFPIFGPASEYAARASIAARLQGKEQFLAFHDALFKSGLMEGKLHEADVNRIAKQSGLNMPQLKKDMNSKPVRAEIKNNYQLSRDLKLTGTPAFVIYPTDTSDKARLNKLTFIPGGAPYQQLNAGINRLK